jgi:hypothetical protein
MCKQKAKECLRLADQFTDPRQKRAMMQFAEWWLRLVDFPHATDLVAEDQTQDRVHIEKGGLTHA